MTEFIEALLALLFIIITILVPTGMLCKQIFVVTEERKPRLSEAIKCFIPVYNLYLIRKMMYTDAPIYKFFYIAFSVYAVILLGVRLLCTSSSAIGIVCSLIVALLSYVFIFAWIGLAIYCVHDLCDFYNATGLKAYSIVCLPLAAFLLTWRVSGYYNNNNSEDTFGDQ